jgi:hypothetical protein
MTEDRKIDWETGQPRKAMTEYLVHWKRAIEAAADGDNTELANLLASDMALGPDARELIAKLLRQRPFGRKRGRPETPVTELTEPQAHLEHLKKLVEYHRGRDAVLDLDTAIELALWEEERVPFKPDKDGNPHRVVDHETLRHVVTGRHGSTERRKRRQRHG